MTFSLTSPDLRLRLQCETGGEYSSVRVGLFEPVWPSGTASEAPARRH